MKKNVRRNLTQAAACLICAIPAWRYSIVLEGTEFSGGTVTGPLLSFEGAAAELFVLGLVLAFLYRRIAAVVTVAACVLCLPVYLQFIAPGPFRWVVRNVGFKGPSGVCPRNHVRTAAAASTLRRNREAATGALSRGSRRCLFPFQCCQAIAKKSVILVLISYFELRMRMVVDRKAPSPILRGSNVTRNKPRTERTLLLSSRCARQKNFH